MVKRLNITLPEELITKIDKWGKNNFMDRSELIKNALVEYIAEPLSAKEQAEIIDEIAGTEEASLGTIPTTATEQNLKTVEEVSSELKPMCDRNFCKSRSEGKYKVVTNSGEEEWIGNLCTWHWNQARKEGEVSEN